MHASFDLINFFIYKEPLQRYTRLQEIPGTRLLVSLNQAEECTTMEIFDVSKQNQAKKIFFFGEAPASILGLVDTTLQ